MCLRVVPNPIQLTIKISLMMYVIVLLMAVALDYKEVLHSLEARCCSESLHGAGPVTTEVMEPLPNRKNSKFWQPERNVILLITVGVGKLTLS